MTDNGKQPDAPDRTSILTGAGLIGTHLNRAKSFYFLFYAANATLTPFLTLYYQSIGLSGSIIGVLTGVVPLTAMVSSIAWSMTADATRRYRAILLTAVAGLWLAVLALSRAASLPALIPAVLFFAIFSAPIAPLIDSSVVALLGEDRAEYGRVRLWGSVGWGLSALFIGPILERAGLSWAFYGFLFLMGGVFIVGWRVPLMQSRSQSTYFSGLRRLLADNRYLLLLLVALVYGMSLALMLNYLFLYMKSMGASETLMGFSLTVATLSEIPFLFLAGRFIRRFGVNRIVAASVALMAARVFAFSWMPAPWWVIVINLFHGPTFALFWAAGVAESNRVAPPGLDATAQGALTAAMFGLGSALGNFLGGIGYEQLGAQALFRSVAWLLVATLIVFVVVRLRPHPHLDKSPRRHRQP